MHLLAANTIPILFPLKTTITEFSVHSPLVGTKFEILHVKLKKHLSPQLSTAKPVENVKQKAAAEKSSLFSSLIIFPL